ncbi:MAG: F0F1 ATP synthase subunit delta [Paracoccaceae bacterium]
MSESASTASGIAGRYALAVFDLVREAKGVKTLEADVAALEGALNSSSDFRSLVASPVYSRDEQAAAVAAIAKKMKLSAVLTNTLGLLAAKRRLFVLPELLTALTAMIADEKGEVTADVTAPAELTKTQATKLAASLKKVFAKDVKLNVAVDETLIGGLIVKVGSKMIDTSIRSKLASLQNIMKEVG